MKHHQTLRRGLGILLSLLMCLTLLPAAALAEGTESVMICGTTLVEGTAYVPNSEGGIAEKPEETETNYLEYSDGVLTVYGSVTIALSVGSADNVLKLESGALTIKCPEGSYLTLDGRSSTAEAVFLQSGTMLTLTGKGDVTILGSAIAVSGGTLETEDYFGDIDISTANNLKSTVYNTVLNLDTTGDISLSGFKPVAGGSFTVTNAADVTITGSTGNVIPDGSVITATGSVSIECTETQLVVTGLTVNNAQKVTLTGNTQSPVAMSVTFNNCERMEIINKCQTSTAPIVTNLTVDGTTYNRNCYGVTVTDDGNGTASTSLPLPIASVGTEVTLSATPARGYVFKEWQIVPDDVDIIDDKFTMPQKNVTVKAVFELSVAIDENNFPDKNFRDYVRTFDTIEDGTLSVGELEAVESIDCSNMGITDLTGIEFFTELTVLRCHKNQLTSLDLSKNTKLVELKCYENQLKNLNVKENTILENLLCYKNQLTSLDISNNKALTDLRVFENKLTSLDVSNNKNLTMLFCYGNQLTSLDVSKNTALITLSCFANKLTSLYLSDNDNIVNTKLEELNCHENQLTSLDVSKNTALITLNCSNNRLTSLNLSNNSNLEHVQAYNNRYDIEPEDDGTFDLSALEPFGFNVRNVKPGSWKNGSVEGKILTVQPDKTEVTYDYDCGKGKTFTFTLPVNSSSTAIQINDENFPDKAFQRYLSGSDFDRNGDGYLSRAEIPMIKTIDVSNMSELSDLTGIEYFINLEVLKCSSCALTSLEPVENANFANLQTLNCNNNQLTSLDVSKFTALQTLNCNNNQLTSLDVSKLTALQTLNCNNNQLTSLDVSTLTDLQALNCSDNKLTSLNLSKNESLLSLYCGNNQLTSLDIHECYLITTFNADGNDYRITLTNGTFDLNELEDFWFFIDDDGISEWTNGTVDGMTLTVQPGVDHVTYKCYCYNGKYVTFKLSFDPLPAPKNSVTVKGSYASVTGAGEYAEGETVTLSAGTRIGYTFSGWTSNDITIPNANNANTSFVMPDKAVTVTAGWTRTGGSSSGGGGGGGGSSSVPTYAPTVTQPENGAVTVNPSAPKKGDTVTIAPTPEAGYTVEQILVTDNDGNAVTVTDNGNGTFSFTQPTGRVNVTVTFMEDNSMLNFFVDVPADVYYYDAVLWAAKKGITGGTSDTTFSPGDPCTRAQIVTFLWRAAGCPEPESPSSLSDVPADAYYAKAVAWALENGITTGTGGDTFSPDATCTRAQTVAFLYRAEGSPAANGSGFFDVSSDAYYSDAVAWAVSQNITSGTGGDQFSPDADCTRAQIVTFLYRCLGEE